MNKVFTGFIVLIAGFFMHFSSSAQSWSPLGSGIEGTVNAIIEYNDELYVGGLFAKAGNVDVSNIAKWDGRKWTAVASGVNGSVFSFCVYNGELYIGGNFTMAGSDSISYIAKWNGKVFMPVGKGMDGRISAMAVFNNELYVAGQFDNAGGIATSNIAKWNGKAWSVVGSAIAKWENNAWNIVGSGINGRVFSLCVYDSCLYAAGKFTYAGVTPANYIAKWDGTNWSALGSGISIISTTEPYARALAVYNNELYITGFFNAVDGITVNNITRWNGKNFLPAGTGIEYSSTGESFGRTMIVYNGELYVGGIFSTAGPSFTTNIAKWNGKAWSAVEFKNSQIICFGEYKVSLITGGVFKRLKDEPNNITSYCPYVKADFTMEPSFGKTQPLKVMFTNTSTGSKAFSSFWDFGDETVNKDVNPTHTFKNYGNTPVTLYATSREGCASVKIKFITIDSMPPSKPNITENKNVLSLANPQPNEKYQWFFNNNKIIDANTSSYLAIETGTYHLLVTNTSGSSTSDQLKLVVVDNAKIAYNNLDANNINARFNSEGSMFWDFTDPMYEVPKGSGKSTIYTGALWIGGYDNNHKFHLAAQTYRRKGTDFWAGPVMKPESYSTVQDSIWNKVWKITKQEIEDHKAHRQDNTYIMSAAIANWPGNGNSNFGQARDLAPYADINNNGIYDPKNGDYPLINGDQAVFFIFNDDRTKHTETQADKLGIEVRGLAYAFNAPEDSALNNTIFLNYKIINRSKELYNSVYAGVLTDFDIGMSSDDYIGSDILLNTYFGYNGDDYDEGTYGYGKIPPAQGVTFLNEVMTNFIYYNNTGIGSPITQDPENAENYYNYMQSVWKDKSPATYGGNGYGGKMPANYMFSGWYGGWTEGAVGSLIGDRRGLGSIGPLTLKPGESKNIDLAYITACDYSGNMLSVDLLKQRVAKIKEFYNTNIAGKK
ncbi:MAG: PKD domain-containing protein [Bacteroidales bacterium]